MKGVKEVTVHTVKVYNRRSEPTTEEVYDPNSDHPQDVERVAMKKAELVQLKAGQSARDRPEPTRAEVVDTRTVEINEVED